MHHVPIDHHDTQAAIDAAIATMEEARRRAREAINAKIAEHRAAIAELRAERARLLHVPKKRGRRPGEGRLPMAETLPEETGSIIRGLLSSEPGITREELAERLNAVRAPTATGRGTWHRSTIGKALTILGLSTGRLSKKV